MSSPPPPAQPDPDATIRDVLTGMKRVAVVGISAKEERPSHGIAKFLIDNGYEVVGVNPVLTEVLGIKVYPSLSEIPEPVDVVDIFRRSEAVPPIVDEAIQHGAKVIWMQEGIVHAEAAARAREAGLTVVMDHCIYREWLRLMA